MVAKKDLPANTVGELVAWMKANPGKINYVNQNAAAHVTAVLFEQLTGQKMQLIPYRGAGPAMTDLISGQVDLLVVQGAAALPQIRAGKIKALANLSPQRSASIAGHSDGSDETGVRGPLYVGLVRLLGAEGHAQGRYRQAQCRHGGGAGRSGHQGRFTELGLDVAPRELQTPEGLATFQKAEIDKWWPIIKGANIGAQAN